MPPTTENVPDKTPHDVYGTLVILTFLFVGVASWMLYDHLTKDWAYGVSPRPERAVNITVYNDDPTSDYIKISDTDLKEWQTAAKHYHGTDQEFPERDYQWPNGYDPIKNPVKANANNLTGLPEEQQRALLAGYKGATAPAPAPAPAPKPEEAPKAPAPPAPPAPPPAP